MKHQVPDRPHLKGQIFLGSTNTDVVLVGMVKHPEDASKLELFTTSSVDITCVAHIEAMSLTGISYFIKEKSQKHTY